MSPRRRRGVAAAWSTALGVVVSLAWAGGCGGNARPPQDGELVIEGGTTADAQQFQNTKPTELSCNLGPDGGVCACADQPLLGDPPNLYFVLDRSASMLDDDKWHTIVVAVANLVVGLGPRAKIGATVFPDPRNDLSCGPGFEVFPPTQGDAPAGTAGPVEIAFLSQLAPMAPKSGGTPTAAALQALVTTLPQVPGKTYVILATDGGPNCDIDATCDASGCQLNIEGADGCTPTGTNCCAPDPSAANTAPQLNCLDAQPTIDAVSALAAAGIPVYVVGVPGSLPYASLLDSLAAHGNPAQPHYYEVNTADQAAFTAAISQVAAKIAGTCTLTLDNVPPEPSQVNVFVDEQVLPQDGPDGWTLEGQTVTILGQTCENIMTGAVLDVRVVAGCPTQYR